VSPHCRARFSARPASGSVAAQRGRASSSAVLARAAVTRRALSRRRRARPVRASVARAISASSDARGRSSLQQAAGSPVRSSATMTCSPARSCRGQLERWKVARSPNRAHGDRQLSVTASPGEAAPGTRRRAADGGDAVDSVVFPRRSVRDERDRARRHRRHRRPLVQRLIAPMSRSRRSGSSTGSPTSAALSGVRGMSPPGDAPAGR